MREFKSHIKSSPPLFTLLGATGIPLALMGLFLLEEDLTPHGLLTKLGVGLGIMGLVFFISPFIRAFLRKP